MELEVLEGPDKSLKDPIKLLEEAIRFERDVNIKLRTEVVELRSEKINLEVKLHETKKQLESLKENNGLYYKEWVYADIEAREGLLMIENLKDEHEIQIAEIHQWIKNGISRVQTHLRKNKKKAEEALAEKALLELKLKKAKSENEVIQRGMAEFKVTEAKMNEELCIAKSQISELKRDKSSMANVIANLQANIKSTPEDKVIHETKIIRNGKNSKQKKSRHEKLKNIMNDVKSEDKVNFLESEPSEIMEIIGIVKTRCKPKKETLRLFRDDKYIEGMG